MKDLLKLGNTARICSLCLTLLGTAGSFLLLRRKLALLLLHLRPRKPILPGPDPDSDSDPLRRLLLRLTVPGLRNLGNNCFLNAILQALASSESVLFFFGAYKRETIPGMEESCPILPLTKSLRDLIHELSILNTAAVVVSPRHVMLALEQHAKQFSLLLQQDAAEALAHLTDALQKERLTFCQNVRTYKESFSSTLGLYMDRSPWKRIVENDNKKEDSPLYGWKPQLQFPIKGTMGSMLTCQKCGFQFSVLFQSFYDVPLSPLQQLDGNVDRCNLEACLTRFTAPEYVTNVRCSQCSHALILSILKQRLKPNKVLIRRIEECTFHDDCACEDLVKQEGETWRNVYVNAWKQLRFGQCPELLCCQVQRAVMSRTGELMKYTNHVAFPLAFDLSPYLITSLYFKEKQRPSENLPTMSWEADNILRKYFLQRRSPEMPGRTDPSFYNMLPPSTDESNSDDTRLSICSGSEDLSSDNASSESTNGHAGEGKWNESSLDLRFELEDLSSSKHMHRDPRVLLDGGLPHLESRNLSISSISLDPTMMGITPNQISHLASGRLPASEDSSAHKVVQDNVLDELATKGFECSDGVRRWMYNLISVVVHSGSPKAGHYVVYRRVKFRRATAHPVMSHNHVAEENLSRTSCGDKSTQVESHLDAVGKCDRINVSLEKLINEDDLILWFRVSDSRVQMVSEAEVLAAQASLLFYERQK